MAAGPRTPRPDPAGPLLCEKHLDDPHHRGSDARTCPPNHPHPPPVGLFCKSCVLYWKGMEFCFLPRVGCFSIKIIFSFNSCSRGSPLSPGLGVSLVLCLQVSPNLVVTQSKKLGPIWENIHAPWLASRPEGPASVTSAIHMHCQDGSSLQSRTACSHLSHSGCLGLPGWAPTPSPGPCLLILQDSTQHLLLQEALPSPR